jgi:hypothetical protein
MITAQYNRLRVSVGASNRAVIRAAYRLLGKRSRYTRAYRTQRHLWLRAILAEHRSARELYQFVMRGMR